MTEPTIIKGPRERRETREADWTVADTFLAPAPCPVASLEHETQVALDDDCRHRWRGLDLPHAPVSNTAQSHRLSASSWPALPLFGDLVLRHYNADMLLGSPIFPFRRMVLIVVVGFVGCLTLFNEPAMAQGAPPAPTSQSTKAVPVLPHAFWDRTNLLLFSGIAVVRGMDYASTRNFQARGRQEILLPDDVVNNSAGFASLEAAATMTSVGISYLFHRTNHHKLERWLSIGHIGVTAFGDIRNYSLESRHPNVK